MKYVLIMMLYSFHAPSLPPLLMHKTFNSYQECEKVRKEVYAKEMPKGIVVAGTCVSADALIRYERV